MKKELRLLCALCLAISLLGFERAAADFISGTNIRKFEKTPDRFSSGSSSRSESQSSRREGSSSNDDDDDDRSFSERHPHCHRGFLGVVKPDDGWRFTNSDNDDYSVERVAAGTPSKRHRHCVWGSDGLLYPAPGYRWCRGNKKGNYCVELFPRAGTRHEEFQNVIYGNNGTLRPIPGYCWSSSSLSANEDYRVMLCPEGTPDEARPNVVYDGHGYLKPAPGYQWVANGQQDFRVKALTEGTPHEKFPHVIWTGDGVHFRPVPGYVWISQNPTGERDFRVREDAHAYKTFAGTLVKQGDLSGAKAAYQRAMALDPLQYNQITYGSFLRQNKDYAGAIRAYEKALSTTANMDIEERAATSALIGFALEGFGKKSEADARYIEGLITSPDTQIVHRFYGKFLARSEKYPEAERELRRAVEIDPKGSDHADLAEVLRKMGRKAEALAEYRKALELDPQNAAVKQQINLLMEEVPLGTRILSGLPVVRPDYAKELRDAIDDRLRVINDRMPKTKEEMQRITKRLEGFEAAVKEWETLADSAREKARETALSAIASAALDKLGQRNARATELETNTLKRINRLLRQRVFMDDLFAQVITHQRIRALKSDADALKLLKDVKDASDLHDVLNAKNREEILESVLTGIDIIAGDPRISGDPRIGLLINNGQIWIDAAYGWLTYAKGRNAVNQLLQVNETDIKTLRETVTSYKRDVDNRKILAAAKTKLALQTPADRSR